MALRSRPQRAHLSSGQAGAPDWPQNPSGTLMSSSLKARSKITATFEFRRPQRNPRDHVPAFTSARRTCEQWKVTTRRAEISIRSPVFGFRPILARLP